MSDKNKAEKLAAAKKRLKQFQAQSQQQASTEAAVRSEIGQTPADKVSTKTAQSSATNNTATTPPIENGRDSSSAPQSTVQPTYDVIAMQTALAAAHEATQQERHRNDALVAEIQQLQQHVQQLTAANNSRSSSATPPSVSSSSEKPSVDLQQELHAHAQTIAVLVNEKSDLAANLAKFQSLAREKIAEVEELQGRLNASRHRVQTLERDLSGARQAAQSVQQTQQSLCTELEAAHETITARQRRIDELLDGTAELRQQLVVRTEESATARKQLQDVQVELGLARLKITQLSGEEAATFENDVGPSDNNTAVANQSQIEHLELVVERLLVERDQAGEQYQTYVQQLTTDNGRLAQQLSEYAELNGKLSAREESLVQHLGELERQMQQQMARQATNAANAAIASATENPGGEDNAAVVSEYEKKCAGLVETVEQQATQMAELRTQLETYEQNIARLEALLERTQDEQPDVKSVFETMQGDKLTASRAVAQNVQLKQQLEELQTAFVQLSNDKLELTERLQSEQYLGRENKFNAEQRLEEMTAIKEKLHFKDEEMIRLSHENEERNKEILLLTQDIDRMRHYEANAQTHAIVQKRANDTISRLQNQIAELNRNVAPTSNGEVEQIEEINVALEPSSTNEADTAPLEESAAFTPLSEDINMPTEEAMHKLQERFTRTMSDIADLTEEKGRLEHLVMQLQGETETIGEYISLYQSQRQQLKQRELEKDLQMQSIVHDREEMRQKLVQLNELVERLIHVQPAVNTEEANHDSVGPVLVDNDNATAQMLLPSSTGSENTAAQILHLLEEIQDKNQNKKFYNQTLPDVHQCACCYGKLETV